MSVARPEPRIERAGRSPAAIELHGVSVERGGQTVLSDISLRVARGSLTGVFGPSGSGKSTLMRTIAGVQARVHGHVEVDGLAPGSAAARRALAYTPQAASVYEDLTVVENLRYFASVRGASVRGGAVGEVLERVGLVPQAERLVRNLSGGQRARVSLAIALLGGPRLLLLDEPTVGLDPLLRRELWRLFAQLARAGATLFISSHVLDEARHCDEVVLLREGRLLAQLTPSQLVERTGTDDLDEAFVRLIEGS